MEKIYTTTTQLAAADRKRYHKQYTINIPEVPALKDILELEVIDHSPRWAWAVVNSPEGFGQRHKIKLMHSNRHGDVYLGTFSPTYQAAVLNISDYRIFTAHSYLDDITIALDLPFDDCFTHGSTYRAPVDFLKAWEAIDRASMELTDLKCTLLDMYKEAKQKKQKQLEDFEELYEDAPKGSLQQLAGELNNDTFYLSLTREQPLEKPDPKAYAINRDLNRRLIRATRLGSGFRYKELLGIYDRTANWYEIRLSKEEKANTQWSTTPDAFWMEKLSTRKQQEF